MKNALKKRLLSFLVRNLLNGVTEDDIVLLFELKKHPRAQSKEVIIKYKDQASKILESNVWKEIYAELKLIAQNKMFNSSQSFDDMLWGKYCLLILETIQNKLEKIKNLHVHTEEEVNDISTYTGSAYGITRKVDEN